MKSKHVCFIVRELAFFVGLLLGGIAALFLFI